MLSETGTWSFGIIELIYGHFKNRVLLKPVLGGAAGVAYFFTLFNRVCYVHSSGVLLASKGSNYSELIYNWSFEKDIPTA